MLASSSVFGHPGHGDPGASHYWVTPEHFVAIAILGFIAFVSGCYAMGTKVGGGSAKVR